MSAYVTVERADNEAMDDVRHHYRQRKLGYAAQAGKIEDLGYQDQDRSRQAILRRLYHAERRTIIALRNSGRISNEVMHRLERELDLEESNLNV